MGNETLEEFIDNHISNYNGVRLYIDSKNFSDEVSFKELDSEDYSYLKSKKVKEWSFEFGTFYIQLKD